MKFIGSSLFLFLSVPLFDGRHAEASLSGLKLVPISEQTEQLHHELPHPLEESKSWDLHLQRKRRKLKSKSTTDNGNDNDNGSEDTPYTIVHKKPKKHIPLPGGDTTHGFMIDAGSQGTRLHIYEWKKRILFDQEDLLKATEGMKLSIPTSNSRWTDKYTPGLDVFAYHKHPKKLKKALKKYLGPLIDFAKDVLKEKEDEWHTYPIFLKATGGMRTLPKKERVRLINAVRELFNDHKHFNPFAFKDEQARVISGEEEAIYGWVGVNFAKQNVIESSLGSGVSRNPKLTCGMLEMGGASTQIAFYENHGDIMADLFKMQLGGARHWNVYTHSYLYSGINGAWSRLNARLRGQGSTVNPCLPVGSSIEFASWITMDKDGDFYPRSATESVPYNMTMFNNQTSFDYEACSQRTFKLLRTDANKEWCEFEMDGSCAFAGIYQPPLPQLNAEIDEFVATSNFVDVFNFLGLGSRAAVSRIEEAAQVVCSLEWSELKQYNSKLDSPIDESDESTLAQMCFRSVFVYQLVRNGWKFGDNFVLEVADVINGQKLGWALGCMLYEINTLPWEFHPEYLYRGRSWWLVTMYVILGILGGSVIGFTIAMRTSKKLNKRVRESVFFKNTGLANNKTIRKSLAMPVVDEEMEKLLAEHGKEYDKDEKATTGEKDNLKCKNDSAKYT